MSGYIFCILKGYLDMQDCLPIYMSVPRPMDVQILNSPIYFLYLCIKVVSSLTVRLHQHVLMLSVYLPLKTVFLPSGGSVSANQVLARVLFL